MLTFLLRRLALGVAVLWTITTIVFIMFYVAPSNAARAIAGRQAADDRLLINDFVCVLSR